jgi:hypothetical protein
MVPSSAGGGEEPSRVALEGAHDPRTEKGVPGTTTKPVVVSATATN